MSVPAEGQGPLAMSCSTWWCDSDQDVDYDDDEDDYAQGKPKTLAISQGPASVTGSVSETDLLALQPALKQRRVDNPKAIQMEQGAASSPSPTAWVGHMQEALRLVCGQGLFDQNHSDTIFLETLCTGMGTASISLQVQHVSGLNQNARDKHQS